jgi:hypothetical protein
MVVEGSAMGINVAWTDSTRKIVKLDFQRGWTWDDLYAAIQQADNLITSVSHTVNMIIDISHAGGLPRDFMRVAGDVFDSGEARANEGQKIVVGASGLIQLAYGGFQKVYGHKLQNRPFQFAPSLDAAYALLESV